MLPQPLGGVWACQRPRSCLPQHPQLHGEGPASRGLRGDGAGCHSSSGTEDQVLPGSR